MKYETLIGQPDSSWIGLFWVLEYEIWFCFVEKYEKNRYNIEKIIRKRERKDEENYKLISDHRKATGADEKKPFGGERESGFPKNMKNRDDLKKMKLSEKLFTESDSGEYSNKLYDVKK